MANFLYPNEKMDWHPTIEEAINHHLEDFS